MTFCEKHLKLFYTSNPAHKEGEKQLFSPYSKAQALEKPFQVLAVQGLNVALQLSCSSSAPYIIIQGLVIQLLQLCLVIPELDPIQHLCQQQNQGIFVPAARRETQRAG